MKLNGILNGKLMGALTSLKHLDRLVICDAGFPVQSENNLIDISLVKNIPTTIQVLQAVIEEIGFEEYCIFECLEEKNPLYYDEFQKILNGMNMVLLSPQDFVNTSNLSKLIIRTGDLAPFANIILTSSPGKA